jgi:hypothetical protein
LLELAYRASRNAVARPPTQVDAREVYHSLCPLAPLSPVPKEGSPQDIAEQAGNEAAYRQLLVQGVLAVLLPTEDLENECLTSLVGQILSELIIGNVIANKASQPWLVWEGLSILAGVIRRRIDALPGDGASKPQHNHRPPFTLNSRTQRIFLWILQWIFLVFTSIRVLTTTLVMSFSLPSRLTYVLDDKGRHLTSHKEDSTTDDLLENTTGEPAKVPVVAFKIWPCISNLVEMDVRMPWLAGAISMLQLAAIRGPGRIAGLDGIIDR